MVRFGARADRERRRCLFAEADARCVDHAGSRLGGGAFPTGRKWAAVASQPAGPRYIVANADESEPGTFKDRVLLEGDPFALVESMTIAAFAVCI